MGRGQIIRSSKSLCAALVLACGFTLPIAAAQDASATAASAKTVCRDACIPTSARADAPLSRTKFNSGKPRLSSPRIGVGGMVAVDVGVRHAGARAGGEFVQLHFHDQTAGVTRPIRELNGFERVAMAPGETKIVRLTPGPDAFSLWHLDMGEVVNAAFFDIDAGPDNQNIQIIMLEII